MTSADRLAPYESLILAEMRGQLEAIPYSYAEMLRQELGSSGQDGRPDELLRSPALCLLPDWRARCPISAKTRAIAWRNARLSAAGKAASLFPSKTSTVRRQSAGEPRSSSGLPS